MATIKLCIILKPYNVNSVFISDANFVSSFEYKDNFVYFFLREKAVEERKVGTEFKLLYRKSVDFFQFTGILVYSICNFYLFFMV